MQNLISSPFVSFSILAIEKKERIKFIKYNNKNKYVDYLHIDISDNKKSITLDEIKKFKQISNVPLDVHIAKSFPQNIIQKLSLGKDDNLCIHVENNYSIKNIKKLSRKLNFGLAINLETSINKIKKYVKYINYVLFMAATPGVSGLGFNEKVIEKIKLFKKFNKNKIKIHADGGINNINCALLREEKVDLVVSGSYLMKNKSIKDQLSLLMGKNFFKKISYYSQKKIPKIQIDKKIIDAIKIIDKYKIGLTLVYNKNKLVGLVSDGDIRRYLIKNNSIDGNITKVVNKNFIRLKDLPMLHCLRKMKKIKKKSAFPIVNEKGVCTAIFNGFVQ